MGIYTSYTIYNVQINTWPFSGSGFTVLGLGLRGTSKSALATIGLRKSGKKISVTVTWTIPAAIMRPSEVYASGNHCLTIIRRTRRIYTIYHLCVYTYKVICNLYV